MRANQKQLRACLTLVALLAGVGFASPATADHVPLPDSDILEMQAVDPCEWLDGGCPDVRQPICDDSFGICDRVYDLLQDTRCNVNGLWDCIEALLERTDEVLDYADGLVIIDTDGDRVPDDLESEMCGRAAVRDALQNVPEAGSCASPSDYDSYYNTLYLFVPQSYSFGSDYDDDGIPHRVNLQGHYIVVTWEGQNTFYTYSSAQSYIVDGNDYDRNTPVPFDDADAAGDYAREQAEAAVETAIREAEAWAEYAVNWGKVIGTLLFSTVEQTSEETIQFADETAAATWQETMDTWQPIYDDAEETAEDAERFAMDTFWWAVGEALRTVDAVQDMVDEDRDQFPDEFEDEMCYIENQNSDLDGTCYYGDYRPPY